MSVINRKKTKASKVAEQLRGDILTGVLSANEKLLMADLKRRYGVGFSPLREALSNLASLGHVKFEEQCGFSVAPLSLTELYDLYKVRSHIETLALELSIANGDVHWEADVIDSWTRYEKYLNPKTNKKLDTHRWDELQKTFLFSLVKACQSPWLLKIRDMLYDHAARYRVICLKNKVNDKKFLRGFIKENEQLVQAVLARNTKLAIKLTNAGWDESVALIKKSLKR